jgi:hypothetical protein
VARTASQDIEAVWNAVRDAQHPRIHMVPATLTRGYFDLVPPRDQFGTNSVRPRSKVTPRSRIPEPIC